MLPRNLSKKVFGTVVTAVIASAASLANDDNSSPFNPNNTNNSNPSAKQPKIYKSLPFITSFAHCEAKAPQYRQSFSSYSYPANNPSEDRFVHGQFEQWTYGAVFDGHGGWQIADLAARQLLSKVFQKLNNIDFRNESIVDEKITDAFNDMEQTIVDTIRPSFQVGFGEVAKVGSCVLVALKREDRLIVANCGDCRAVLGSTEQDPYNNLSSLRIYPTRINRDHNCRVLFEQEDLARKHPDEPNLIVCKNSHACYVKGRLQLTRSLGDAYLKYAEFNGNPIMGRSSGRFIPDPYTPPYVSHQPDVYHFTLNRKEDKFLILGTDGLWDYLPDVEAVDIVYKGMQKNESESKVAERLVERALEIAAEESGMTLAQLKNLQAGKNRRGRHDDTTAVVIYF